MKFFLTQDEQLNALLMNEEHGIVNVTESPSKPEVGEIVSIIPNHTCVVTNLHDTLVGIRKGRIETVWEVAARGTVR